MRARHHRRPRLRLHHHHAPSAGNPLNQTAQRILYGFACVTSLILAISSIALVSVQARDEARQGIATKHAVCALRHYYQDQINQGYQFLKLSQAQRVEKYGAIGNLPDATLRASIAKEHLIVTALGRLNC